MKLLIAESTSLELRNRISKSLCFPLNVNILEKVFIQKNIVLKNYKDLVSKINVYCLFLIVDFEI